MPGGRIRVALLAACAGLAGSQAAAAGCRQALALGIDVSASVDLFEYALQRDGLAFALGDPEVRRALLSVPGEPVAVMVYQWTGPGSQVVLLPWTDMTDDATILAFAAGVGQIQRGRLPAETAIGEAMIFARGQFALRPDCRQLTLDLAGDGESNAGPDPQTVAMNADGREVTVNELAVAGPIGHGDIVTIAELSAYFLRNVVRGPGSFVETAVGYGDFQAAMTRKLLKEIVVQGLADAMPPGRGSSARWRGKT